VVDVRQGALEHPIRELGRTLGHECPSDPVEVTLVRHADRSPVDGDVRASASIAALSDAVRVVQSGFRRAKRDVEGLGDLRQAHPEVVMECEDSALIRRQPRNARSS
jgi:hypothetical protein